MQESGEKEPGPARRLFVAIDAPMAVSASLAALAEPIPGFQWTRAEALHLTLRFVGDTEEDAAAALVGRLRHISGCASFTLSIGGVGAFPERGAPKVVWAGVGTAHPRLHQLRQRVDDAILASGLSPDMRSFHPHFTLARCAEAAPAAVQGFLRRRRDHGGPSFLVDRFHLYESVLHPEGAEHRVLESFSLAPG